jgi:catechol 2,3-dioxygenase-like lactoylglutathione lyase family enzyme
VARSVGRGRYVLGFNLAGLGGTGSGRVTPRCIGHDEEEAYSVTVIRLDHVVIAVSDWERSIDFYGAVVGAEVIDRGAGRVCFRIGDTQLNVHGPGFYPKTNVARLPVRPGNSDICFRWDGQIEEAVAHLRLHGVEVETGPVARPGAGGDGTSVYFRDPDGSLLEFIAYAARDKPG